MSSTLNIATSGLLASQTAIDTIGNNIANVNTPGYSRQRAEIATSTSVFRGGYNFGTGSQVKDIARITDDFALTQLRANTSLFNQQDTLLSASGELESVLAQEGLSISKGLQNFFQSLQQADINPDYSASRTTLFSQAGSLVGRFNTLSAELNDLQNASNTQIDIMVNNVNALTYNIARLNDQIASTDTPSPDLLDRREVAVRQLAELIDVRTIEQSDGSWSVVAGDGQTLINGSLYNQLGTQRSASDPQQYAVVLKTGSIEVDVTHKMTGGKLGGTLAFQNDVLKPAKRELDLIAIGVADSLNSQHQLGVDSNGNIGGNIFTDINTAGAQQERAIINQHNTGNAALNVSITDVSSLPASDYRLDITTGPAYSLTRLSDNKVVNSGSLPMNVDGFSISLDSGSVAVGDNFLIAPTRGGASRIGLELAGGSEFALGSPVITNQQISNTGSGNISAGRAVDTTNAAFATPKQLSPPVRVEFLSASSYRLLNDTTDAVIEGPIAYTPGGNNAIFPTPGGYDPGYRVDLTGAPSTGDTFNIDYNIAGRSDNRNGGELGELQDRKIFIDGNHTFNEVYANTVASVGVEVNRAEVNREASHLLMQQSEARVDSVSGVNLDEEATELLKYQQSYQAASKVVQIAVQIMDTLLNSIH